MKTTRKLGHREGKGLLCKVEVPTCSSVKRELFSMRLALGVGWFQVHHQPELETAEQRDFQKLKKSHSQGIWDLIEGQVAAQGLYNFLEEGCSRVGAGLFFQVTSHGTRGNYLKITKRITKHWNRAEVESSSLELFKKPLNVVLEDRV